MKRLQLKRNEREAATTFTKPSLTECIHIFLQKAQPNEVATKYKNQGFMFKVCVLKAVCKRLAPKLFLWVTLVGNSWDALVGHSCGTLISDTLWLA